VIYLACPYSHPNPRVRAFRFGMANRAAAKLILEGHTVFSPLSHSHPIAETGLIGPHDPTWYQQDLEFLRLCSELRVLCLSGWRESRGVLAEVVAADRLFIPVVYLPESYARG
jgi:hypothetical protein